MDHQERWQLDGSAPELYERHLVPAMTAAWAAELAERAGVRANERVLDLACGTGVVARVVAQRVGVAGEVAALDINPGMLEVARSLPTVDGAPIAWHEGSVLALPFVDGGFDVVLCQLGLQFFSDRSVALGEMRRVLAPDGRLGLSVFGPIEHNPAPNALATALDRHGYAEAALAKREEHALADRNELRELVAGVGFRRVEIHTLTKTVRFPSSTDYVRVQLVATPLATLTSLHDRPSGEDLIAVLANDVGVALSPYARPNDLSFPQQVHILLARH